MIQRNNLDILYTSNPSLIKRNSGKKNQDSPNPYVVWCSDNIPDQLRPAIWAADANVPTSSGGAAGMFTKKTKELCRKKATKNATKAIVLYWLIVFIV